MIKCEECNVDSARKPNHRPCYIEQSEVIAITLVEFVEKKSTIQCIRVLFRCGSEITIIYDQAVWNTLAQISR